MLSRTRRIGNRKPDRAEASRGSQLPHCKLSRGVPPFAEAQQRFSQFPPEARTTVILQLEILCGIAKGLTRTPSPAEGLLLSFEEEPGLRKELDEINAARDDGRMANLRQMIISAVGRCVEVFGSDVGVGQVRCILSFFVFLVS